MNWLNKLNRKIGRFAIPHLMYGLSFLMLAVFAVDWLIPGFSLSSWLMLDRALIAQGQIWRLITFIFLPPDSSPIFILFSLYFYCLIGNALEREWGSFRFNVFYLCGMLGTILASLITGWGTNLYLNFSLFLAFAALYPDFQLMLFFIIPIKIKYLAILDVLYFIFMLVVGDWSTRAAILFSLLNIILFFGGDFLRNLKKQSGYWKTRRNFRKYMR